MSAYRTETERLVRQNGVEMATGSHHGGRGGSRSAGGGRHSKRFKSHMSAELFQVGGIRSRRGVSIAWRLGLLLLNNRLSLPLTILP